MIEKDALHSVKKLIFKDTHYT